MDWDPQKFEDALEGTSKNVRAIGHQNFKFVSGELQPTSQSCPATVDREPQKFEDALERTSKTPGLLGTRTSHLFQGSFNQLQRPSALLSNRNFTFLGGGHSESLNRPTLLWSRYLAFPGEELELTL